MFRPNMCTKGIDDSIDEAPTKHPKHLDLRRRLWGRSQSVGMWTSVWWVEHLRLGNPSQAIQKIKRYIMSSIIHQILSGGHWQDGLRCPCKMLLLQHPSDLKHLRSMKGNLAQTKPQTNLHKAMTHIAWHNTGRFMAAYRSSGAFSLAQRRNRVRWGRSAP